ncbi:MAG: Gfo/Idh/MocA family oxidoreductase [Clostridia bacterium]|nr:Gfo/Idh/MocA family oxidoreductase [Clostridia bacterium]
MVRIAMLSKWHVHAPGYAHFVKGNEKAELVAIWDDDKERGEAWAKEMGCPFFADLDELLVRDDIDAVVCDAPTTMHKEVLVKAAKAGKHIFTEKALCPTVAECLEVKKAVEEAGVTFVISYPQRGRPCVQFAKKMAEKGAFGDITFVRVRDAHNGVSGNWLPEYWFDKDAAAGGAMMDLGCHPMYLLAYFLGKPKRVTGICTAPYGKPVDENAVAVAEFEGGAIGVAETGFISTFAPQSIEVVGTKGAMMARGEEVQFRSDMLEGVFNWYITPDLPEAKASPLEQFINAVDAGTGSPEDLGIDDAIALTELLELFYIGNDNNKIVEVK